MRTYNPNQLEIILDDDEAERLCIEENIARKLEWTPDDNAKDFNSKCAMVFTHPTHWLTGIRVRNNPITTENGYLMVAIPKSVATKAEVVKQVQAMLSNDWSTGMVVSVEEPDGTEDRVLFEFKPNKT